MPRVGRMLPGILLAASALGADLCPPLEAPSQGRERVAAAAELPQVLRRGRIWLRHRDGTCIEARNWRMAREELDLEVRTSPAKEKPVFHWVPVKHTDIAAIGFRKKDSQTGRAIGAVLGALLGAPAAVVVAYKTESATATYAVLVGVPVAVGVLFERGLAGIQVIRVERPMNAPTAAVAGPPLTAPIPYPQ